MLQGRAYAQACIRKMRHAMRWPVSDESFSGCPTKMDSHPCSIEKEIPRHACRANDGQLVSAQSPKTSARRRRSDDLNIVSKHLRVIDHLLKHRFVQSEISRCQHCAEQGRHVFHEGMPSRIYSRPRNELRLHGSASIEHAVELKVRVCIERVVKARGRGVLSQRLLR